MRLAKVPQLYGLWKYKVHFFLESANVQCSMLIVAGHQVKQEKKCESLQILELTKPGLLSSLKPPDPTQAADLQDMKDTPSRSCSRPGQDDKGGSRETVSVKMLGQA